jgi:CRISPR-associated protein Csm4
MNIQTWGILGRSFHFGLHGVGQEKTSPTLGSDSLFAALVARLARSSNPARVEEFCRPFVSGSPPFVLTSTFPLAGRVRFFPPPITSRTPDSSQASHKLIKKVLFVSESLYRKLLDGEMLSSLGEIHPLQNGKVWASKAEIKDLPVELVKAGVNLWAEEQRPRVSLDRASQASLLYFTGQVTFAAGCGLWFGLRWLQLDPALQQQLAALLADLADAGLGAERNSGLGGARIQPLDDLTLPDAEAAGRWTTLSRYLPGSDETSILAHPGSAYTIRSIGGWLDSPARTGQRRRNINLLAEGSVLGSLPCPVPGQVVDVRPVYESDPDPLGHPVYRSGLALAVGMKGAGV